MCRYRSGQHRYGFQARSCSRLTSSKGNAKIEGMLKSLNMTDSQYNVALSLFFVPYILFGK